MKCTDNCGYYCQLENDAFPRCYFDEWCGIGKAPCEYDDECDDEYDDELEG